MGIKSSDIYQLETFLAHLGEDRENYHGAVVPPIFQNSLFTFKDWQAADDAFSDRTNAYIYSRGNNPTVNITEQKLAKLAGAERVLLFGSGMAAVSAAILHCVSQNGHIITIKNVYGPANNFMNNYLKTKLGISTTYVSGNEVQEFADAIQDNTQLIYLESPSSGVFSMQDLEQVATLAKSQNIKTVIDNSWASPYFQKPLQLGIDLEVHSCTKYIGGHSDVVAGCVMGSKQIMTDIFLNEFELLGGRIAPLDAWLLNRSLRTLPMRLKAHQESAMVIATHLESHPKIEKVNYPGLKSHPQHELGKKQMTGYTGLLSFRLKSKNLEEIKRFFNHLNLFQIGVSWGGHESLIYALAISYLKEFTAEQFEATGIALGDMRISVGLENVSDLIKDLDQALSLIE